MRKIGNHAVGHFYMNVIRLDMDERDGSDGRNAMDREAVTRRYFAYLVAKGGWSHTLRRFSKLPSRFAIA